MRHAATQGGEKRLRYTDQNGKTRFLKLDGYVQRKHPEKSIAIEFNGCVVHGHECIKDRSLVGPNGKTMERNRHLTAARAKVITDAGLELRVFWQCEVEQMLSNDKQMREEFSKLANIGPIEPRDSFCGLCPRRLH